MRRFLVSCLALIILASPWTADAGIDARMLRYPDVSKTEITFVYAGDIWVVPRSGGTAQRLSSPPGEESFPRFSPNGTHIAFSGDYDGNVDIYLIPSAGGDLQRLTHHPAADRVLDFSPDGSEILFASRMTSPSGRYNQIWKIPVEGGLPERLPMPYGEFAALSADGHALAYQPASRDFRTWKRYRGGLAPDIWLFDLSTGTAQNLTANDANDSLPMWHDGKLYFLSDRGRRMRSNLWVLNPADPASARQLTFFEDFDIHFPSIGPDAIVFEAGGRLYLFDLRSEKASEVDIEVVTDRSTLRPKVVSVGDLVEDAGISPSGKRVLFTARGEIFSVPAEHGPIRNLTGTSGIRERNAAWSPDGKSIAYFSDADGEWNLYVRPADGKGRTRQLTDFGPGHRFRPFWSPDSKKIVFIDEKQIIHIVDVENGTLNEADHLQWISTYPELNGFSVTFSPDSRWMAYRSNLDEGEFILVIYDLEKNERHQVGSGFYRLHSPEFDAAGEYIFCMVDRSFSPSYSDFDGSWIYADSTRLAAISLRKDVPSPMAPRSDEEGMNEEKDDKGTEANKNPGEKTGKKKKDQLDKDTENNAEKTPEPVTIDFDGIENRIVLLQPEAGNFGRMASVEGKLIYLELPRTGAAKDAEPVLKYYDFEERESKTIIEGIDDFEMAAGHEKLLIVSEKRFGIIDVAEAQKMEKPLPTSEMKARINPTQEWRQIFTDVWRIERDLFYDPAMHGVDWNAMKTRYGALVEDCVTRRDLNYVLGELIGELNTSHSYRGGGDLEKPLHRSTGLLGVDWERSENQWRVAHIIRSAAWETVRSPLEDPGIDFSEGDYVLAVNGVPLGPQPDPWAGFEGLAGRTVELTVNSAPTMEGAHTILIKPMKSESRLRNLQWIEANRRRVAEATDGKVGYVYVPDTGIWGQSELVRQFVPQAHCEGMIVDERFNGGGQWPDRFIELISRPRTGYIHLRNGHDLPLSTMSRTGPSVMLVNSWAGSGGDAFPYLFRRAGLGPIIGTRTWGGLVGISQSYPLVDGGGVTAPSLALYTPEGEWMLEGHGLEPDIEVIDDPAEMARGVDPQLERAITEITRLMTENPTPKVKVPSPGDRTATGIIGKMNDE